MRFRNVCIEGTGYNLPETILSSRDIERQLGNLSQKMKLSPGFLELLTGIRERRIWEPGTKPSSVAGIAAKRALANARVEPGEVDLLIHTGVCRDSLEPATASVIQANLGLSPHCMPFDLSNACLGFLNGLWVASHMIASGNVKTALVVSGENAGPIYRDTIRTLQENPDEKLFRKHLANLTLGSGAVAFVLKRSDLSFTGHFLLGGAAQNDTDSWNLCQGNGDLHHQTMETDTVTLMKKGIRLSHICWQEFKKNLGWNEDTPDIIFNHQVSRVHQNKVFECLGLDVKKGCGDFEILGNTGTVATPLSLALRAEKGLLKKGQSLGLLGIGSGLNCLMLGVQW